jgi:hypothetical protein
VICRSDGDYESEEGSEEEHMHGEEGHSHEGEEGPVTNAVWLTNHVVAIGDKEVVDEVESEDQMAYEVAEDNLIMVQQTQQMLHKEMMQLIWL